MPLEKDDFGYELEDDLFDQLSSQAPKVDTRSLFGSYEHKRTFFFNHLKEGNYGSRSDYTFSLRLIRKTQTVKNEAKLILGLLNVLFWFDLAILDLHTILVYLRDLLLIRVPLYLLDKINRILSFFSNWLKKFKQPLYARLEIHKHNSNVSSQI